LLSRPKREKVLSRKDYVMWSLVRYILHHMLLEMTRSRRMSLSDRLTRVGKMRILYKILTEKSEKLNHSKKLGVDGLIIFDWMLKKEVCEVWTGYN
jgi:hypothetical protein